MEYVSCNLCRGDDTELLYPSTLASEPSGNSDTQSYLCTNSRYGIHPPIVRCRQCGLVYANPRREEGTILDKYEQVVDRTYLQERQGRVLTFQRNLRPLEELMPPKDGRKLLDVGCHIGVFVEIAQDRGWDAWGVEPSQWAVEKAQERGLRVIRGTLEEVDLPPRSFDVVTMWDVVEHLTDPKGELEQIHRILKPGGLVCIHTMDIESPFARILGHRWPWLMEMHLYYFSRETLSEMLRRTGYEVVRTRTQGRFLRLRYLISRVGAYTPRVSNLLGKVADASRLNGLPVPVNLGDLFTAYGRKLPGDGHDE